MLFSTVSTFDLCIYTSYENKIICFFQGTRIKQRKLEKKATKNDSHTPKDQDTQHKHRKETSTELLNKAGGSERHRNSDVNQPSLKRKQSEDSTAIPVKKERLENKVFISSLFRFNPDIPSVKR